MLSQKTKILAVDDNSMNLRMMAAVIRENGREILTASSGYQALDILKEHPDIALVLMDIQMPGLGGFETVEQIKKDPNLAQIPIIFISGIYNKDEFIEHGYALGAYEFMLKPFEAYLLKNKVNVFIKLYQQQRFIEKKLAETALLSNLNRMMIVSTDLDEIIASVCESIHKSGKFTSVSAFEAKREGEKLDIQEIMSWGEETVFCNSSHGPDCKKQQECPITKAIETKSIVIEHEFQHCPDCPQNSGRTEKQSFVAIPLLSETSTIVLSLLTKSSVLITEEDVQFFNLISDSLVFGLDAANLKAEHARAKHALQIEKEELRISVDCLGEGVIRVDSEGKINMMNRAAKEILDVSPTDEYTGEYVFNICRVIGRDNAIKLFNPIDWLHASGDHSKLSRQITIITKSDYKKILQVIVSEIKDQSGFYHGIILVIRDITEELKVEQQKALSQKLESIGSLAAGIAHEINTPMQFIGDNETFLKDSFQALMTFLSDMKSMYKYALPAELQDNVKDSIEALENQHDMEYITNQIPIAIDRSLFGISRVNKIITSLRNFSHSSNRDKAPSNINKAIEDTIIISTNEWKYVATMNTNLDASIPLVTCAIDEINQVFINMIINATHTIKDKIDTEEYRMGKIDISTQITNNEVEIIISDNGMGIPQEFTDKIFDPFFTTKEVGRGTGQGLSIAHDIINKHNGRISFETEKGVGTSFHIFLPIG